jgi:hypothetical protein
VVTDFATMVVVSVKKDFLEIYVNLSHVMTAKVFIRAVFKEIVSV